MYGINKHTYILSCAYTNMLHNTAITYMHTHIHTHTHIDTYMTCTYMHAQISDYTL